MRTVLRRSKAAGHAQPSTAWMHTITDEEREDSQVAAILERTGWKPKQTGLASIQAVGGVQ